jgi:hypothetical protein
MNKTETTLPAHKPISRGVQLALGVPPDRREEPNDGEQQGAAPGGQDASPAETLRKPT